MGNLTIRRVIKRARFKALVIGWPPGPRGSPAHAPGWPGR